MMSGARRGAAVVAAESSRVEDTATTVESCRVDETAATSETDSVSASEKRGGSAAHSE
jgi:hypothetical protein